MHMHTFPLCWHAVPSLLVRFARIATTNSAEREIDEDIDIGVKHAIYV